MQVACSTGAKAACVVLPMSLNAAMQKSQG